MKLFRVLITAIAIGLVVIGQSASAQQFPTKVVKIITPFPGGQGPDVLLRLVAEKLSRAWGQQVIVENRPGANGFIAFEAAKRSAPDGYTLVQMDSFHLGTQQHLFKKLPYSLKDFEPITTFVRNYFFVVVPANSNWKNMTDLISAAKVKPDAVSYGSWYIGSAGHLGGAALETATGTRMTHVAFKDSTQLYSAVGNNDVNWAFGSAVSAGPLYRAGKVKFLAVAAPKRIAEFPDVPTVAEAGGPAGFELPSWFGLLAPRGTPSDVLARIHDGVVKAMSEPDVRERLATFAYEPFTTTPAEMAKMIEAESQKWGPLIKSAKIELD